MPNPIGYSFAPTFENSELAQSGGRSGAQPSEAVQVLSYRLPRVVGHGAISPLVGDQFRGGPNMSVLESVFKTILGPEAAAAFLSGQMGMPTGQTPSPVVRPGLDPTRPGEIVAPQAFDIRDRVPGGGFIGGVTGGRSVGEAAGTPQSTNPFAGGYRPF